ncbi:hypothetical protein [Methanogenium cariaci]|uniref:hypothetical protein n=1 Tax=Methanogenium cariaci TaxID=2197 RepID=UPI0012F68650|nr:hypothetical protein [Methanogenium cariaci]
MPQEARAPSGVTGQNQQWYATPAASGWNMVGSLSHTIACSQACTNPPTGALGERILHI